MVFCGEKVENEIHLKKKVILASQQLYIYSGLC